MESKNDFFKKTILNKNRTCYNFDDTMRFDNNIVDNILLDNIR